MDVADFAMVSPKMSHCAGPTTIGTPRSAPAIPRLWGGFSNRLHSKVGPCAIEICEAGDGGAVFCGVWLGGVMVAFVPPGDGITQPAKMTSSTMNRKRSVHGWVPSSIVPFHTSGDYNTS